MPLSPTDPPPLWQAEDYIIHGKYADLRSIRNHLLHIRHATAADAVLLLVYQNEPLLHHASRITDSTQHHASRTRLFQSLLLVSHVEPRAEVHLGNLLRSHRVKNLPNLPDPAAVASWQDISASLDKAEPFRHLTQTFPADTPARLIIHPHKPKFPKVAWFALILVNPARELPPESHALSTLHLMINASVPVLVHRSLALINNADTVLSDYQSRAIRGAQHLYHSHNISPLQHFPQHGRQLIHDLAHSLLEAALKLTGSSVENLSLAAPDTRRLLLAAQINNTQPLDDLSLDDTLSVVGYVYSRKRPLLINDLSEFRQAHPHITYKWVGAPENKDPYAELAVPIPQVGIEAQERNVLGVINVENVHQDNSDFYTYNDLAILRDIALRFCLIRQQLFSSIVDQSLAEMAPFGRLENQLRMPDYDAAPDDQDIPAEISLVKQLIHNALRQLFELTDSASAIVRLLSPDGSCLIRFLAFPKDGMQLPFRRIDICRRDSVNAWVAREGKPCHIPDLYVPKPFRIYKGPSKNLQLRPTARSEYCTPVILRGRVIGAINLQSEYANAYAGAEPLIATMTEQIRLAILFSRTAAE